MDSCCGLLASRIADTGCAKSQGDRWDVGRAERGGKGLPDMANPTGQIGWEGIAEGGTGAEGAPGQNPSIREWPCVPFLFFSTLQAVGPAAKHPA